MAVSSPPFITDTAAGVGLDQSFATSTLDGYDNPFFLPGTQKRGTDGSLWMFVKAATTINLGDCVSIDNLSNASQMTNALATAALTRVGVAGSAAIASGAYGWVALCGDAVLVSVLTGTNPAVALYTTATAGVLSSTSTSQVQIFGISTILVNSSGSTATRAAMMIAPRLVT